MTPPEAPAAPAAAPPEAPAEGTFSGPPTLGDQYPTQQYPMPPGPPAPPSSQPPQPYAPAGPYPSSGHYPPTGHYPPGNYPGVGHYPPGGQVPPGGGWTTPPAPPWGAAPPGATPPSAGWGGVPGTPVGGWAHPGYGEPASTTRTSKGKSVAALAAALVLAVAILAGAGVGHLVWSNQSASNPGISNPNGSGSTGNGSGAPFGGGSSGSSGSGSGGNSSTGAGAPSDISAIASKVDPGSWTSTRPSSYQNEQAAGTGMVLTSSGEVLTNNHVIDGATSISVTDVGNGKTYTASVVGYDRTEDIAVLQLQGACGLQTVKISMPVAAVGQAIVGIGNAGGTGGTPSYRRGFDHRPRPVDHRQ